MLVINYNFSMYTEIFSCAGTFLIATTDDSY